MTVFLCAAAGGNVGTLTPQYAELRFDCHFLRAKAARRAKLSVWPFDEALGPLQVTRLFRIQGVRSVCITDVTAVASDDACARPNPFERKATSLIQRGESLASHSSNGDRIARYKTLRRSVPSSLPIAGHCLGAHAGLPRHLFSK